MSNLSFAAWQTTLPGNLPTLFYAFDETQNQTERVAGFYIDDADYIDRLLSNRPNRLRIRIGADPDYDYNNVPFEPAIQFFLEGLGNKAPENNELFAFTWDPNPPFLEQGAYGPDSGPNEIPPDGAILFARAWLETPYEMLGDAFEGADSSHLVQRVKYYTFQADETASILDKLEELKSGVQINLYLGSSIPVSGHPFGFRPVLEIRPIGFIPKSRKTAIGKGGSAFFDFSNPCPPMCDQ